MAACEFDSDMIDWEEDEAPSSPFLTTVAESRQASASHPTMDSLFDEPSPADKQEVRLSPRVSQSAFVDEEKENAAPRADICVEPEVKPVIIQRRASPHITEDDKTMTSPPPLLGSPSKQPLYRSPIRPFTSFNRHCASPPKSARPDQKPPVSPAVFDSSVIHEDTNLDDTCFSAFSAVPDMTLFSRLADTNKSPSKRGPLTPRETTASTGRSIRHSHGTTRSPSPTPRRLNSPNKEAATPSLLIDFTQQLGPNTTATRSGRLSPSRTEPNLLAYINDQRTPGRFRQESASPSKQSNLLNLLDFELPPPPTPRSTPTFTVREMESLKSAHQSQLLSIRAKLSGKEAEVESMKKALEDAERRVGEAQESARDDALKREQAEQEKLDWERRGMEVENVLKTVKEEVIKSEEERVSLSQHAEEFERRAEEAEAINHELRAKLASVIAGGGKDGSPEGDGVDGEQIQQLVQLQLDQKMEGISRELHAVYKKKHETKVATLKRSYEARAERKCAELQSKLQELARRNEQLTQARDAASAEASSGGGVSHDEHTDLRRTAERYRTAVEEQNARMVGIDSELKSIKADHSRLLLELERERAEKGDLVAAVDEMLSLQAGENSVIVEDFRRSISSVGRPSGLRAPGTIGATSVAAAAAASGPRPGRPAVAVGGLDRSKTMTNASKMTNRM